MKSIFRILFVFILFSSCKDSNNTDNQPATNNNVIPAPSNLTYSVVNIYPHDIASFTEGLIWHNGSLLESTGEKGTSYLLKVNLQSGKAEKKVKLGDQYFGEGLAVLNNKTGAVMWKETG